MNVLIVGDGPIEQRWARYLADAPGHRLIAAYPSLKAFPGLPGGRDLDDALSVADVEACVIGGDPELRAEALRRAAAAGLPSVVLMPPGSNADPFYQVALSRHETGAIVVPDLPAALHPGVDAIRAAIDKHALGGFRELRYEVPAGRDAPDLVLEPFPQCGDAVRECLGDVASVTATGDPVGDRPTRLLVVQLRAEGDRRGEVRVVPDDENLCRLTLYGEEGSLRFEHDAGWDGPSRLVRRTPAEGETTTEIAAWDPRASIFESLLAAVAGDATARPDLLDGTRAMELAEAVRRSLRKGRTIDLDYEEMTESGNFRSVMTGLGCGLLLSILVIVPIALAGPALGMRWTIYLAWAIPPVLVLFVLFQLLGLGLPAREAPPRGAKPGTPGAVGADDRA
jgi:myo-inositol 2-dehydrogenase/D-chiro-inositol 1-dehydrogenase